jgi:hypothetical protein|tara:strand:+ start:972 stop:1328 length:357 start_codon:yes stop_codon:yes gene_type:complete
MTAQLKPYYQPDGAIYAPNEQDAVVSALQLDTATTAESHTFATSDGIKIIRIQADQDIYYAFGDTAVAPSDEDIAGASIYLPAGQERLIQLTTQDPTEGYISCVSAVNETNVNILGWG